MTTADELARKAEEFGEYLPSQSVMADICPDYVKIQSPLMWGGIWQQPGLDLKLRSLATISAQCVNGWDFGLQHQIRVGLTMGISPQSIKGIFIQLLFYTGIPTTVYGLIQARNVINERQEWRDADIPMEADWLETVEEKLQRGSEIRQRHWGELANQEIKSSLAQQLVPEAADIVDGYNLAEVVAADIVDGYNFGEVWARSDLQPKERMVCILAALMARGHMGHLRKYIGYALNMGFNQKEICEVLSQAGWYRGWPHVEDSLEQAQAVFEERGL